MHRSNARGIVLLLCLALAAAGCSREEQKPAESAPPEALTAATPAAPPPQQADDAADEFFDEELYVDLEGEPDEGPPPLTVKFTSEVEDGTPPYKYSWDFGDGSQPGSGPSPSHTYEKIGDYVVTLRVTDSKGLKGSEEYDIYVEEE